MLLKKVETLSLFRSHRSILSHQKVRLLLLDVLMKALAILSHGPGHSFSLSAHISLGFTGMERSRPSVRLTVDSSALPFRRITTQVFLGQCSALLCSFPQMLTFPACSDLALIAAKKFVVVLVSDY